MNHDNPHPPHPGASPTALRLIRMSLLLAVVSVGAVVTFMVQGTPPEPTPMARPLQIVNVVYLIGAMVGIMYFQRRHAAEPVRQRRVTFNVVAWALGESTALFGAVHYLLVGSPIPFLVGLGMLLAAFVLVPIRD
ncbi:MAG TPA: hypothetical protein VFY65_18865 [Longimicrobium sp.]|nr:hypothetical protein [Longimicrobium sp.]